MNQEEYGDWDVFEYQNEEILNKDMQSAAVEYITHEQNAEQLQQCVRTIVEAFAKRNPYAIMNDTDQAQACLSIEGTIKDTASYLNHMRQAYALESPVQIVYSFVPATVQEEAQHSVREMLKEPAVKNVCTNLAYRMARIQSCSGGKARIDGDKELRRCEGIVKKYLEKHGQAADTYHVAESSRYLASQIVKKANVLVRDEVIKIYQRFGDVPDPAENAYDSRLLKEREQLLASYDTFPAPAQPKLPGETKQHEESEVTQSAKTTEKPTSGHDGHETPRRVEGAAGRNGRTQGGNAEKLAETSEFPKVTSPHASVKQAVRDRLASKTEGAAKQKSKRTQARTVQSRPNGSGHNHRRRNGQ